MTSLLVVLGDCNEKHLFVCEQPRKGYIPPSSNITATARLESEVSCPSTWHEFNGHCYKVGEKTFLSAQKIVFKNKLSPTEFWFWNKSSWSWNRMESLFQHLSCLFCRYFQEFTSKLPWTKARRHCRALGGRLISLNDRDASNFIYKTFKKYVNPFLMKWVRECVKLWNLILKCVNITSPWYKVFWPIRNWLTSF